MTALRFKTHSLDVACLLVSKRMIGLVQWILLLTLTVLDSGSDVKNRQVTEHQGSRQTITNLFH